MAPIIQYTLRYTKAIYISVFQALHYMDFTRHYYVFLLIFVYNLINI